MFERISWIFTFLIIACFADKHLATAPEGPRKAGNMTEWDLDGPKKEKPIDKRDLVIGLTAGSAILIVLLTIFAVFLKRSRSSTAPKPETSNIYVVLPNGQTVQGQKAGTNVTVSDPNDIYALGNIGAGPLLPPRVVDDDDTYARIVESIYSTTPADKVLSLPMDQSASTGSHYGGFMGPSMLNPAYGAFPSHLISMDYRDPRMLVEYRSHDGLSFADSTGEGEANHQSSEKSESQPVSPQVVRSVSQSEMKNPEPEGSDEANTPNKAKSTPAAQAIDPHVRGAYGPLPGAYGPLPGAFGPLSGAYGPLPGAYGHPLGVYGHLPGPSGPLFVRPMPDNVSHVMDGETGYRSRVYRPPPHQFVYVRDPESGYRTRVLNSTGLAPAASHHVYTFDPESGVRSRVAGQTGAAQGSESTHGGIRPGQDQQASSSTESRAAASAAAAPKAAAAEAAGGGNNNAADEHSGDSHDGQSSTASGLSSSCLLRPSVPRQGYAAAAASAASAGHDVADVPTVIRRFNADTGEEYIYTLAVSRLPRTNVERL